MNQDIKKKYSLKIAIATKAKDQDQIDKLNQLMKEEKAKNEVELQEKSTVGKAEIKDRFNVLSQQIKIDTEALVSALLTNGGQNKSQT